MWSAVKFQPYNSVTECIYALNGTSKKRIEADTVYDWGIAAPLHTPTIGAIGSSGLTGDYLARYSFARTERTTVVCDSNLSPAPGVAVSLSAEQLRLYYNRPTDPQVNMVRLWRTSDGGTSYYHDIDMQYPNGDYGVTQTWEADDGYETGKPWYWTVPDTENGSENCYGWEQYYRYYDASDTAIKRSTPHTPERYIITDTADSSLGTAAHTDHDPPPLGDSVFGPTFDGTLFILDGNNLYYSKPKQPEYWPTDQYIIIGPPHYPGKCGVLYDKQPYVLTQHRLIYVYGTSSTDFITKETSAKTGTVSEHGAVAIEGLGIFHVAADGIYLAQPGTDSRLGQDMKVTLAFDRIFRGETVNGVAGVSNAANSWLMYFKNKLVFGYPGPENTYPAHFLVMYLDRKQIGYWTRGHEIITVCHDTHNDRLLAVDTSGYVWVLEDQTVTDDDGTAIEWEVESKAFILQTRAHFPRWTKYDVKSDLSDYAFGDILLDDTVHHRHVLSDNRSTRRRLVDVGNGERCSLRLSGAGPVEIYAIESE